MKHLYLFIFSLVSSFSFGQNVTITKIIETGCSSPFVKTVELYVDGTVDFSTEVVLNYMNNGAPWADNQIDISALGLQTDAFVYLVRDIALMEAEFPNTTFDASNTVVVTTATNGDDGYQVVLNGVVVSQFGKTETDADLDTDSDWNHNDTVAIRLSDNPDIGVWDPTQWEIRPENDLDTQTFCQTGTTNLETYFNTLGGGYPLGTGSGWTPTGPVCTTILGSDTATCESATVGTANDTYTATLDFEGANNGNTFSITASAGTVGGDDPTTTANGTITVSNIPEGTDITISVSDTANGGVCDLSRVISSPDCIPLVINELHFDPAGDITGDANGDGIRDNLEDEFLEFFNNSGVVLDLSGYTISDAAQLRHTFPASTIVPPNGVIVVFGGGTPTGTFGGAIVQTASEGNLALNNAGDVVTLRNPNNQIALLFASNDVGISFGQDQSVTRNPDITGDFVLHTDANSALLYSPGLRVDGSTLSTLNFEQLGVKIYPNPVGNGVLHIDTPSTILKTVELFDLNGRLVLKQKTVNSVIDVNQIEPGLYILNLDIDGNTATTKLIVK